VIFRYLISIFWLIWLAYWIASSFGNKPAVYQTNWLWRFSALLVVVVIIALWWTFPNFFDRRLLPRSFSKALVGTILCGIGVAFSIWARAILGRNWSSNPTIKEGHELVQTGPYRLVRHPIYTGILVAVFGTSLASAKVGDLVLILTITIMLIVKLRIEESLMQQQFAEKYTEYRSRTKALIPFIL
jgi:protein-S-isoprenylcysteine O-methyltransferase Ste14